MGIDPVADADLLDVVGWSPGVSVCWGNALYAAAWV